MEIYLIRHTPVNNPQKLCYGQSDIELANDWEADFAALQKKLNLNLSDAIVYSSSSKRCSKLAGFLSGDRFQIDAKLLEMNFGDWELCEWTAIDQTVLNAWMANFVKYQVPGGENFVIMHQRCTQFWEELTASPSGDKIIVVTHAGVIRSILAHILNIPLDKIFQLEIDYSSVTKVTVAKEYGCFQTVNYVNR